jgi:hypothetical protein
VNSLFEHFAKRDVIIIAAIIAIIMPTFLPFVINDTIQRFILN